MALGVLAGVSELAYAAILAVGQSLHVEVSGTDFLLLVLALFAIAFICYLVSLKMALAARQDRGLLAVIFLGAVGFRLTLLFSDPIEEIDLYRYLWDGEVTIVGVSPFRFSPRQVLEADSAARLPADLLKLVAVRDRSPNHLWILERVHFGELPTIYPPISQGIFALSAFCTPPQASLVTRMTIMKAWFVGFDLATLVLVILLLRWTGKPVGWSLAYGWCPLLVKEFANSGHLDALAVFLSTLAIYLAVRGLFSRPTMDIPVGASRTRHALTVCFAMGVLGLAIGAKLYPIVLVPLLLWSTKRRLGWRTSMLAAAVGSIVMSVVIWPMVPRGPLAELAAVRISATDEDLPPLPPADLGIAPRDPSQSLRAFLSEWEMNDFLFLLIMENTRPTSSLPSREVAWFSVVPETWRTTLCKLVANSLGIEEGRAPFFISRAITLLVFLGLSLWLAGGSRATDATRFLEAAFLTTAWFWLLLPTQNPWYWTWSMPFLPFARGRAWLVMSGLAFLYYVRFWLAHHFLYVPVLGTSYRGPQFFDFFVVWIEFGLWFVWLAVDALRGARCASPTPFVSPQRG